jgi:hypothetical protein
MHHAQPEHGFFAHGDPIKIKKATPSGGVADGGEPEKA